MADLEGRSCPLAYRYLPVSLCQEVRQVSEDVVYVIGGLYGNPLALDEIEQMALADEQPDIQKRLSGLPRYRCLMFGGLKILVLHGDPESLAGWGLAHESFAMGNEPALNAWFRTSGADVMVSTHTCLPALWSGMVDERFRMVANNGSAGMGNLLSDPRGLITRLGFTSPLSEPVAGIEHRALNVSLMPVSYDLDAWLPQFDQLWPAGSAAAVSYRKRIISGTSVNPEHIVFPSIL